MWFDFVGFWILFVGFVSVLIVGGDFEWYILGYIGLGFVVVFVVKFYFGLGLS